ncbi:MAG: DUF3107 domain-containing protein [Actinobacteria bacterium]|nr:DUF3107 domain-containing protein [Actinomycetota bacterium]
MATSKSKATGPAVSVEVRVWVQGAAKEITITVDSPAETVLQQVRDALSSGSLVSLTDNRGRTVLLAGDRVAAIEVGAQTERRVGFAT